MRRRKLGRGPQSPVPVVIMVTAVGLFVGAGVPSVLGEPFPEVGLVLDAEDIGDPGLVLTAGGVTDLIDLTDVDQDLAGGGLDLLRAEDLPQYIEEEDLHQIV